MRVASDTDVNNSVEEALLKLKLKNLAQVKRKLLQKWFESLTISPFSPFVCLSWGSAPEWAIPTIIPLFCGYRLIRINPLRALPQAIARPHIGWLFKNRGRTGLMPGGVIKIKFHSSKYSHSINHPPYPYVVMQSSLCGYLRNVQARGRPPPANSTPGGKKNLNVSNTQAL